MRNKLYHLLFILSIKLIFAFQSPPPPDGGGDPALVKDVPDVNLELTPVLLCMGLTISIFYFYKHQKITKKQY